MSLLITSNTALASEGGNPNIGGLNTPSSYVNNLNGALSIPPNSEIAVQSVKLSKTGNITAQQGGLTFGFYFGRDFDPTVQNDFYQQTSIMTKDTVGEPFESLNVNELATKTKNTFNRMLWHPNLLENASSDINPGASCQVKRNASNDFIGFEFKATNCSEGTNDDTNIPTGAGSFINTTFGSTVEPTVIGNLVTNPAPGTEPQAFIGITYPLSLAGGEFNCSLQNSSTSEWSVGLCRCSRTTNYLGEPADLTRPSYFPDNGMEFYDYVARQVTDDNGSKIIKLYHAIGDGSDETFMEEIDYGTEIDGVAETIVAVKWEVKGEQVSCKLTKANGSVLTLIDGAGVSASNAKPINMMCRFLYPKVTLEATKSVSIDTFSGVDLKDFNYGGATVGATSSDDWLYQDFWAHLQNTGEEPSIGQDYESENDHNQVGGFGDQTGLVSGQVGYALAGINLIFEETYGEDDTGEPIGYYYSRGINSGITYGFDNNPVALPAALAFPLVWTSSTIPVLKNTNSLFVRLKNMTFDSANFSTSNMSKILYHIPAFSNNGESTGSLFFSASPMVYLKLNNPHEINMTTIEVDIVNSNETISQDLLGKTVVVFHIKESK